MKINENKKRNPSMPETEALSVKQANKKAKVDQLSTVNSPSVEVIDLSDSEESTHSSQEEQSNNECQVNQNEEHNYSQPNGIFINQLLQMNGSLVGEEIDIQDNPNEIFFYEDFDLEETKTSTGSSERNDEIDENSKFFGISKLVRARCSTCKVNFEDASDNQLRFMRKCSECQSPVLFQCRKCCKFYKYFQSVWDHVMRSCQKMEIAPNILELALQVADNKRDEITAPPVITLDSDNENEDTVNFVNCDSTLPFRIESVESRINMEENSSSDCPTKTEKFANSGILRNSEQDKVHYQCYNCGFKAESARAVQRHIVYAHSKNFSKNACSKCRRQFESLEMRKEHEGQCCGKFYYKCKFCPLNAAGITALKNHLVARHSGLFQEHDLERIVTEIKWARQAAKDMFKNVNATEPSTEKDPSEVKDEEMVSDGIEINYNENCADFSKINVLLKIRCCKCKVTFEKVEEKVILYCPKCQAELLYCCRLCNKFFAFFDKAWYHVSYDCKPARSIINTQPPRKHDKAPKALQPTYSCTYCDFTATHKWQVSQHKEMWHSCLNDDLQINFTACSRCGRAFEKPEQCAIHEKFKCGKEMLLVCEFCTRVEDRMEPMRIHLAKMHMDQLGTLSNLENVMSTIKMKRQSARGLSALPVPNHRNDFLEMEG